MKYKIIFVVSIIIFCNINIYSQNKVVFNFLPETYNFLPLRANFEEGRIGLLYFTDNGNLKVDLGGTTDIFEFNIPESQIKISVGLEFMAYALATSFKERRLQIDATDGFFGGHISYSKKIKNGRILGRFRIIHNSAHLVDGHYDLSTGMWIDNFEPIPFTRDFGEFTIAKEKYINKFLVKLYWGLAYSAFIRPDIIKRYSFAAGFELSSDKIFGKTFNSNTNLFLAYQFGLRGIPSYVGNNYLMLGFKFGDWFKKGVLMYISYYSGRNMFSEYFLRTIKKFGLGFYVDIF